METNTERKEEGGKGGQMEGKKKGRKERRKEGGRFQLFLNHFLCLKRDFNSSSEITCIYAL